MKIKNVVLLITWYLFIAAIVILHKGSPTQEHELAKSVFSSISILFSILVGFTISSRNDRHISLRTSLKRNDAALLNIYHYSKAFDSKTHKKIKNLLEEYLISSLDNSLIDYELSIPFAQKIFDSLNMLEPKNKKEELAKKLALSETADLISCCKSINHWANDTIRPIKAAVLLILGASMLFIAIILDDNSAASVFLIPAIATALLLVYLIIKDLNSLRWKEKYWIWFPVFELFKEMGMVPYIPSDVLEQKRLTKKDLSHLKTYRVAYYKGSYPYSPEDRIIKLFKND